MLVSQPSMRIIGHRGARGHAPENTLLAFDCGIKLGCDMLELDVQRCEDTLVVLHDLTVDRTTDGHGLLRHHTLESLARLNAGEGQHVPTLAEVLRLVDQRIPLNIEIKSSDGTAALLASQLLRAIDEGWPAGHFLVSSFDHPELDRFREAAPGIGIAPLLCGVPLDYAACGTELGAVALHIAADFADPQLIADAHARGLLVNAYTVNHVDELAWLIELGVDGIFTDYPDRLRSALGDCRTNDMHG